MSVLNTLLLLDDSGCIVWSYMVRHETIWHCVANMTMYIVLRYPVGSSLLLPIDDAIEWQASRRVPKWSLEVTLHVLHALDISSRCIVLLDV